MTESQPRTSVGALALAWAIVLVPLAWGVYETVTKALALFK